MRQGVDMMSLGLVLIFLGMLLVIISGLKYAAESKTKSEFAFVGFIGPFPIGFGTSREALFLALVLGVFIFLFFILWVKRFA